MSQKCSTPLSFLAVKPHNAQHAQTISARSRRAGQPDDRAAGRGADRASGPAPAADAKPNDYAADSSWLCRPGRKGDACDIDLTTTVVAANGTLTRETWAADPKAPIDCFYVYPTISTDPGVNSDMTPDPAELNVVAQQFARFASKCRVFAPSYRQVTLAGLRTRMTTAALRPGHGPRVRRCAGRVELLPAARQSGTRRGAHRPLTGVVRPHRADQEGNRRQAGPEAHRLGDPPGRHGRSADGKGRRGNVPADATLPRGVADRMRHHLRIVPVHRAGSGERPLWPDDHTGDVGRLHKPGET